MHFVGDLHPGCPNAAKLLLSTLSGHNTPKIHLKSAKQQNHKTGLLSRAFFACPIVPQVNPNEIYHWKISSIHVIDPREEQAGESRFLPLRLFFRIMFAGRQQKEMATSSLTAEIDAKSEERR